MSKQKILVLGWDAAEWKVIERLLSEGKMPAIQQLINRGVSARIKTMDPPLSPMLWTSIATGMRADKHGIYGFIEPTPDGEGLRPVTSTSRKVKAIWNILNQEGYKSNVVSWWPSNPVEPINGVMVSNLYQLATHELGHDWPMPAGTVHPEALQETLAEFRVHPHEITLEQALPFIPNLAHNEALRKEQRAFGVLKTMANAASVHGAACYLLEHTDWDFMAVYHDAIDHFSHLAMRYYPPRRPEIPENDYENYKDVVEQGYILHDRMLARTLSLIDQENTCILLVSDHGFHPDHQRPLAIPKEPSGPAVEHSPYGVFIMAGPGIEKGQRIPDISVLDVTPTLLHYLNLPIGNDMDGRVAFAAFSQKSPVMPIESWETRPGASGQHEALLREDLFAARQALMQLVELGYIDSPDDDKAKEVEKAIFENEYYLARNLIHGKKFVKAIEILQRIYEQTGIERYGQRLVYAYLSTRQYRAAEACIEQLKKSHLAAKTDAYTELGYEEPMYLEFLEGLLHMAMNRLHKALPVLQKISEKYPHNLQVALNIGQVYFQRKQYKLAVNAYIQALNIDAGNARAHYYLGLSFLRQDLLSEAIDEFLIAISQEFTEARFHYHLGEALARAGHEHDAIAAFEVSLRLHPTNIKAKKWLLSLLESKNEQFERRAQIAKELEQVVSGEIGVIVSPLDLFIDPIVQVLHSNNLAVSQREELKNLHHSTEILDHLSAPLIHVPISMLAYLPSRYNYRIVKIELDTYLDQEYKKWEAWLAAQAQVQVHYLDWNEWQESNAAQTDLLVEFLSDLQTF
ncbi:MAG: hypothetical protein RLZZ301_262 [Bacteroidota bacterium]|jgi:predicted AlkP superfamily phosphohydrolase/phosphomutase/tetratricopeptide (TPR) repeat protein